MAGKFPSAFFNGICHFCSFLNLTLAVKVWMFTQPFALVFHEVFACFIIFIGTVPEDTIVAGQSNEAAGSLVSAVRVFFQKGIQPGNYVKIPYLLGAVRRDVVTFYFSVFVYDKLIRISGSLVGVVVA